MLERGISKEHILLEDQSTSTYENLKFSKKLAETIKEHPKYLFISNNYHVFRATIYAKRLKMNGSGVGAKTAGYYIPNAFVREYIAILSKLKKPLGILIALFLFALVLSFV